MKTFSAKEKLKTVLSTWVQGVAGAVGAWGALQREIYFLFKAPIYTKDNKYFKKFDIGDYTYGIPRVSFTDSGASLIMGKFCSIAKGVRISTRW